MGITVHRVADDGLSRQRWDFRPTHIYGEAFGLVLSSYSIERRDAPRGRFRGAPPADRWLSSDERSYTSGLKRPTEIPADVLDEAWATTPRRVYIGWAHDKSEYRP